MLKDIQEAALLKERVRKEKEENRRRAFDNGLWMRDHQPSAEDDRQKELRDQLRRSLDPPASEIVSGLALNILLNDLATKVSKNGDVEETIIPLDSDSLRHLNVVPSRGSGNPGVLKDEGRLQWPPAFSGDNFRADRKALDHLAPVIFDQAIADRLDTDIVERMGKTVARLHAHLSSTIKDLSPGHYVEGKRFLRSLDDALKLLRQPDATAVFKPGAVQGETVAELVNHLVQKGWKFAPALPGDESAYRAVHRGLAAYDQVVNQRLAVAAGMK
jgi:hypothetical protein